MRLDFAVIGAQKSASTFLAGLLGDHPEVWMPSAESPDFRDPYYSSDRMAALTALLSAHDEVPLRGIKCPDYLARPEVAPRLRRHADGVKLIACLREPVSRALSTYYWHVRWGLLPVEDPDRGMRRVLAGYYRDRNPRVDEILDWGKYGKHLRCYLRHFRRQELYIMFNDELRASPTRVTASLAHFLGLANLPPSGASKRAANEGIYAPWRLRFVRLRSRYVQQWSTDREFVTIGPASGALGMLVSRSVGGLDRSVLAKLSRNSRPVLSDQVTSELHDYFAPDQQTLRELLDRPLPPSWESTSC